MSEIVRDGCGAVTAGYDTVNYGASDVAVERGITDQPEISGWVGGGRPTPPGGPRGFC